MRVRWTAEFDADLHRIWMFLAERDVERADRVVGQIQEGALILGRMPRLGRSVDGDLIREWSMVSIQYVVRYRIDEDEVILRRVHHTRENREAQ